MRIGEVWLDWNGRSYGPGCSNSWRVWKVFWHLWWLAEHDHRLFLAEPGLPGLGHPGDLMTWQVEDLAAVEVLSIRKCLESFKQSAGLSFTWWFQWQPTSLVVASLVMPVFEVSWLSGWIYIEEAENFVVLLHQSSQMGLCWLPQDKISWRLRNFWEPRN